MSTPAKSPQKKQTRKLASSSTPSRVTWNSLESPTSATPVRRRKGDSAPHKSGFSTEIYTPIIDIPDEVLQSLTPEAPLNSASKSTKDAYSSKRSPGSPSKITLAGPLTVSPRKFAQPTPRSTPIPKVKVVRGRIESESEDSGDEDESKIPRSSVAFPKPMASLPRRDPMLATTNRFQPQARSIQVIDLTSSDEDDVHSTAIASRGAILSLPADPFWPESVASVVEPALTLQHQIQEPIVATPSLPPSDSENSEYSSGAGVLVFNPPKGYKRPYSPPKLADNRITPPLNESTSKILNIFPSQTSVTSPEEDIISAHSGSEVDAAIAPKPHFKRRGKRMSVWSVKNQTEVIAISSDEDESEVERLLTPEAPRLPSRIPLLIPSTSSTPKPPTTIPNPGIVLKRLPLQTSSAPAPSLRAPTRILGKKATKDRLDNYARELYTSLNAEVFEGLLPPIRGPGMRSDDHDVCELIWSNTLSTTAGRASTRRGVGLLSDGQPRRKVMIELAAKVVDSEDRVRHTLAHEMCHLSVWLITKAKDGGHGRVFKSWASKVMKVRKDIEISSTHAYQIMYKFEWKCVSCGQVYGRHGKSINPTEQRCGVCRGELKALFEDSKATGWGAFLKRELQPLKASRPELSHGEAMKELGRIWRERNGGQSPADTDGGALDALTRGMESLGL